MKFWLTAVIAILGIGAVTTVVVMKRNPAPAKDTVAQDSTPTGQTSAQSAVPKTLKALLALGLDQQCTYSYEDENGKVSGTTYLSGQNISSDFETSDKDNNTVKGHMIKIGSEAYVWTDGMPQGIKMKLDAEGSNPQADKYVDTDRETNYECRTWPVDSSKFTPPTTVSFMDLTVQKDALQGAQCAACAQIDDAEAKTACLQRLGCN